MWSGFAIDYSVMVFFATVGTVQIVAAKNALSGIMLLRGRPLLSIWLGSALIAGSLTWFFASDFRNLPDTGPGLEANTQAAVFAIAAGAAVGLTFAAASILNHRWALARAPVTDRAPVGGMGLFRQTTFVLAVAARLRHGGTLRPNRAWDRERGAEADG